MHHHQILLTPPLKPQTLNSNPDIMYCKKCGKVIPDDSLFCQYCGVQLSDTQATNKQERKGLISRFQSLSKGWQIALMSYVCWAFFWIVLCATGLKYDDPEVWILLFVFILPVLALFGWYYFTQLRHKNKLESKIDVEQPVVVQQPLTPIIESEYSIWPLLQFASVFGKMQVKVETNGNGSSSSYCIFTKANGDVTRVDFSTTTQGMNAADISNRKDQLFIVQIPGLKYKLVTL